MQTKRGGLWVCSSAWCEKGVMRRLRKNALRVCGEMKERACVHSFWLARPLGILGKVENVNISQITLIS